MILDEDKQLCFWKDIEIELTVAEFNLIKSLSQYPGVVKDRNQLMDAMYGDTIYVDDRTIAVSYTHLTLPTICSV